MPKLLLVEDDAMIRNLLTRRLKWEGYQIITAINGVQAIAIAQAERPDLILMDMGLPLMNGFQATERIKADPETGAIPIIALTAYAMMEEREKCLAAGCDDYETKPVAFTRLITKMKALLSK